MTINENGLIYLSVALNVICVAEFAGYLVSCTSVHKNKSSGRERQYFVAQKLLKDDMPTILLVYIKAENENAVRQNTD